MTTKFKKGDAIVRHMASSNPAKYGAVGEKAIVLGYSLEPSLPGLYATFEDGRTMKGGSDYSFNLVRAAPAVETPPAPFARSSKPRPKKPIVPGSRHEQVLNHLLSGKSLTQGEGILLGYGTRVAATIHDLRRRGHDIKTTMKEDIHGAPYAEYRLVTRGANGNRKAA